MPKVNVYLPDALADRVRAANLPISRICQVALSAALGSVDNRIITGDADTLSEPLGIDLPLNNYVLAMVQSGYESARRRGSEFVDSGDLLDGLLTEPDALVYRLVERSAGVGADRIRAMLHERLPRGGADGTEPCLSDRARRVLQVAQAEARRTDSTIIHGNHLAIGLLQDDGPAQELLTELGVDRVVNTTVLDIMDEAIVYSRSLSPSIPDNWTTTMLVDVGSRLDRIEKLLDDAP